MIVPGQSRDRQLLSCDFESAFDNQARPGVVKGPGCRSPFEITPVVEDRRSGRSEAEVEHERYAPRRDPVGLAVAHESPIADVEFEWPAGLPLRERDEALVPVECLSIDQRDSGVRGIHDRVAEPLDLEDRELEAEALGRCCVEMSGVVPPLGQYVVRAEVAWKRERAGRRWWCQKQTHRARARFEGRRCFRSGLGSTGSEQETEPGQERAPSHQ